MSDANWYVFYYQKEDIKRPFSIFDAGSFLCPGSHFFRKSAIEAAQYLKAEGVKRAYIELVPSNRVVPEGMRDNVRALTPEEEDEFWVEFNNTRCLIE